MTDDEMVKSIEVAFTKARLYDKVAKERTHFANIVDESLEIMNDINDNGLNGRNQDKLCKFLERYN